MAARQTRLSPPQRVLDSARLGGPRSEPHMRRLTVIAAAAALALTAIVSGQSGFDAPALKGLELRSIGPALATGRVQDIEIDPKNPNVWYVASGVRRAVEDRQSRHHLHARSSTTAARSTSAASSSIRRTRTSSGSAPGENKSQRSAHFGDGLYKSTDAGTDVEARRPGEVRAHRQDPDRSAQLERRLRRVAGAAVVGGRRARALQDDRRRRDVDGGPARSATTPAVNDIVFDPRNPDVIYASVVSAPARASAR